VVFPENIGPIAMLSELILGELILGELILVWESLSSNTILLFVPFGTLMFVPFGTLMFVPFGPRFSPLGFALHRPIFNQFGGEVLSKCQQF